jgi:predicted CoA-substrate-specific enzyme activase
MNIIGLDVGTLYFKALVMDPSGAITHHHYAAHHGAPWKTMMEWLDGMKLDGRVTIGMSGIQDGMLESIPSLSRLDGARCMLEGAKQKLGLLDGIIDIGGSSLSLIELNKSGEFESYCTNSLCAAGTGSFLDEQARRLGVSYDDVKHYVYVEDPPAIASRCAVFAKSDLIHRQQEGYSRDQMWSGLCRGLSQTILMTLFKGRPITGKILVAGGVSQNREVIRWMRTLAPEAEIVFFDKGHLLQAAGAAVLAYRCGGATQTFQEAARDIRPLLVQLEGMQDREPQERGSEPLELRLSTYCSFDVQENYTDENDTEVRISRLPAPGTPLRGYLGIDIGSTSTKIVLIDENREVFLDMYRKTLGDPIGAVRFLFEALDRIWRERGTPVEILGCATTGSGRKMIGMIVGADMILNEITAHVRGGLTVDPDVETIFEIGGQDSKFIRLKSGEVVDSNMNYICAAGTGSFVEEQANKLGYRVSEIGDLVMGVTPPPTSDRCTVFMEQDVNALIRKGYTPIEALAGIMRSVVKNYLNKVVGRRKFSRGKIAFMGATARNKGLVAAFERHLDTPIVVSPTCHVMGAFGAAISVMEKIMAHARPSTFKGLAILHRKIEIRREPCRLCNNTCTITYASIEGDDASPSWGYLCGRDPDEKKVRIRTEFNLFKTREKLLRSTGKVAGLAKDAPALGIPMSLTTYSYLPMWRRFFGELGYRLVTSGRTDEEVKTSALELVNADFCFPVKVLFGHTRRLLARDDIKAVFIPHFVANSENPYTTDAQFCPWVQGAASSVKTSMRQHRIGDERILSGLVDFRISDRKNARNLHRELGARLGVSRARVLEAWKKALRSQDEFEEACVREGEKALADLRARGKRALLIVGRPYNVNDFGLNVDLPEKISEYGCTVIPIDFLPFRPELLGERFRNMYWNYGQRVLSALRQAAVSDNLNAVYMSNFSCGPDSFILSYAEEVMKDKPMLILELDEHGADAGYITRIEAFLDVLSNQKRLNRAPGIEPYHPSGDWQTRRVWIPPMHDIGARFFAAAFRGFGFESESLPDETKKSLELGRKLTRGSECLPTAATLGVLAQVIEERGLDPSKQALFMPTAEGPCRFGQYATCHRLALEKIGMGDLAILSPSSYNTYAGVPEALRRYLWDVILLADTLTKIGCRLRPYEVEKGSVDQMMAAQEAAITRVLETRGNPLPALRAAARAFKSIPIHKTVKPLVGIVGEIYVRSNPFCNGRVIRAVERFGGEAWLAPISEWILYTSETAKRTAMEGTTANMHGSPLGIAKLWIKDRFLRSGEKKYIDAAGDLLANRREPPMTEVLAAGEKYVPVEFEGEAILTIGRAIKFIEEGAAMVVSANPFGCMPGTISSACLGEVQRQTGVPIVNMFYDGEESINDKLASFIGNISHKITARDKPATLRVETPAL